MSRPLGRRASDPKVVALRAAGALNHALDRVKDESFSEGEFFDARDQVQVKYEMLRRHRVDGRPVAETAVAFGMSRQSFYTASAAFEARGIPGLLPARRGPKGAHKCTDEVIDFVENLRREEEMADGPRLAAAIHQRFGVSVHPRSILRALARREKKLQPTP